MRSAVPGGPDPCFVVRVQTALAGPLDVRFELVLDQLLVEGGIVLVAGQFAPQAHHSPGGVQNVDPAVGWTFHPDMSGLDVLEILYPEDYFGLEAFEAQEMMEVKRLVFAVAGAPGDRLGRTLPVVFAFVIDVSDSRGLLHGAVQLTADAGTVEKGAHAQAQGGEKPARNPNHIAGHNLLEILTTDYRPAAGGVNEPLCSIG